MRWNGKDIPAANVECVRDESLEKLKPVPCQHAPHRRQAATYFALIDGPTRRSSPERCRERYNPAMKLSEVTR
jgi:hypothetical protein